MCQFFKHPIHIRFGFYFKLWLASRKSFFKNPYNAFDKRDHFINLSQVNMSLKYSRI